MSAHPLATAHTVRAPGRIAFIIGSVVLLRPAVELIVPARVLAELIAPPPVAAQAPAPVPEPVSQPVRPRAAPMPRPRPVPRPAPTPTPQPLAVPDAAPIAPVMAAAPAAPVPAPEPTPAAAVPVPAPMAAPAPPAAATVIQPSSSAAYLNNPKPDFPAMSRRLGETGRVIVRVLIGPDGRAQEARIQKSSGFDRLDQVALETARDRWRYVPGTRNGVPEAMWANVPLNFVLE